MHYKALIERAREYSKVTNYDRPYWDARDSLEIRGLAFGGERREHSKDVLQTFLKEWKSYRSPIGWGRFIPYWATFVDPVLLSLEPFSLETVDLLEPVDVHGFSMPVRVAIGLAYRAVEGFPGVGLTNASKILAPHHPNLFVMWDRAIGKPYHDNDDLYMMDCWTELKEAIQSASSELRVPEADAPRAIAALVGGRLKPMARLVDEYNYMLTRREAASR